MPTLRMVLRCSLLVAGIVLGFLAWQRARGREEDRVAAARARVGESLRELCQQAGLEYPPQSLFLRAFKNEAELEIWAGSGTGALRLLETMRITSSSGLPGPKRREGDWQVPEGFYAIDYFNPKSSYHLSMRINYPNASDRILSDRDAPGTDIYVHGKDVSIGCLPLGDANIERLYLLAFDHRALTGRNVPIAIFPARMSGPAWEQFLQEHNASGHEEFWASLKKGYDAFEQTHTLPVIKVDRRGQYQVQP